MKVLVVILGIFCLLISLYPCCIDDNCEPNSVEKISENETARKMRNVVYALLLLTAELVPALFPVGKRL